jgi:hypothetical protein
MKPEMCLVRHDPKNGTYGDCVRACIASIVEKPAKDVPHFFHDDPSGSIANDRIYDFLDDIGYRPFWAHYDGSIEFKELMYTMSVQNEGAIYILFHSNSSGGHCVVCEGGEVVHNPAWYRQEITGPNENGFWSVLVIALK